MSRFPIDRTHPPRRIEARDGALEVHLRPYGFDDVDAVLAALDANEASLRRFMPWAHQPRSRESQFDAIRRMATNYWAGSDFAVGIFSPAGEILGGAGLHPRSPLNPLSLEVGYWGHVAHRGRGVVTLAVKSLIVLAFDIYGCDRVQVSHDEANAESQRVVARCGFRFEGAARNTMAAVDPPLSGYLGTRVSRQYALITEDFEALPWVDPLRAELRYVDALGGVSGRRK